jgi:hypothetical protein
MSKIYCMPFLVLESVEESLDYLLENFNIILCAFFVKLFGGEKWAR